MTEETDALVVGAGIAGLAAGLTLEAGGLRVCVVDAADAPGGVMRTDVVRGHRIERGPSTVRMKAPLLALAERHGALAAFECAAPASRERFLLRGTGLVPVPLGPLDLVRTDLLSGAAKRRLLREPFIARGNGEGESVAGFVERRLGPELVEALVGPFLTGVYAGDERRLGAEAVLPALVEFERRHASIVRGGLASLFRRGGARGKPGTWGGRGGMGAVSARLAAALRAEPRLRTRVGALVRANDLFCAELDSGPGGRCELRARHVVVASDASDAARLADALDPELAAGLRTIAYSPIASIALSVARDSCAHPPRGFGFLVPAAEGRALLGCLFMSQLFEGRAPAGRELLHCMLGGVRRPDVVDWSDDALRDEAFAVLEPVFGWRVAPEMLRVQRWPRAVAQPAVGHPALVRALRGRLPRGLELAGAYLDGVAVSDAAASGVAAAERLLAGRAVRG